MQCLPNLIRLMSPILPVIGYLSYKLHCCTLPDKRCLSQGICLYQVIMTLHFLIDVDNDAETHLNRKLRHNRYFEV